jgi:hypothetical protein
LNSAGNQVTSSSSSLTRKIERSVSKATLRDKTRRPCSAKNPKTKSERALGVSASMQSLHPYQQNPNAFLSSLNNGEDLRKPLKLPPKAPKILGNPN